MKKTGWAMLFLCGVIAAAVPAFAEEKEIDYKHVDAPEPANENGVVTAEEWAEIYPEIVESYKANDDNNYRISYLDEDPYLKSVYQGYGFAKDYTSAISHTYTLEDVNNTERPHPMANCLTCKSPDFTKLVNDLGEEVYQYDFSETLSKMNENISCYNCHENQAGNAGERVVTHSYVTKALGDEMENIDSSVLACGQCHIEYYFDPETKATTMPYSSVETMDPEAILAYYNEIDFADWTQESTGARMLKAQHPEMETYLGAGSVHKDLLNCADCHMAVTTSESGVTYHSHKWESPLENEEILASCVKCHGDTDMKEKVGAIQEEIVGREKEVGKKLAALKTSLADVVAAKGLKGMTEEEVDEVRKIYRDAQWYWDFCYVENSEGAHNSTMSRRCLDKSEELIDQGMELLYH
ncbi:MAG: ammonia-forming cytochrome c nitrite reductase subunit c552 [Eubacteriales bacterium]|nr:ammonia-forming cytochrome c nitrite reductase subunit c552 [Eubacteriales bacterium]